MKYDEFKKTGKSGHYDKDLDEWFPDDEQPVIVEQMIAVVAAPVLPAKSINDSVDSASQDDSVSTDLTESTKKGKKNELKSYI